MATDEDNTTSSFPTGTSVPFPYDEPYPQQIALMDALLQSLEKASAKKESSDSCPVWMLESPTGTGKSLSLACSAVAWLRYVEERDLKEREESSVKKEDSESTGLDWLDDWVPPEQRDAEVQTTEIQRTAADARKKLQHHLQSLRMKGSVASTNDAARQKQRRANEARMAIAAAKRGHQKGRTVAKRVKTSSSSTDDLCVPDYRSDDDGGDMYNKRNYDIDSDEEGSNHNSSKTTKESCLATTLLQGSALDGSCTVRDKNHDLLHTTVGDVTAGTGRRKIIYAARTHSQLSQFVGELKRVCEDIQVVALGGRKALCGNTDINHLTESSLTETCLDWQKGVKPVVVNTKTKRQRGGGCPLLASKAAVDTLALHTLVYPTDIEEAASLGESSHTCAYYATRSALPAAEVVVLPYSMLLSAQTRASVGLSLKEALVIVDEAHNLPEALRSLHSCRLSLPVVEVALEQLGNYVKTYAQRLAGRNIQYLGQLRKVLVALQKHLKKATSDSKMKTTGEFLIECKLDNVNLFQILSYLKNTRLAQKLIGFTNFEETKREKENDGNGTQEPSRIASGELSKHVSAMSVVQTFLEKLVHSDEEGKIVTEFPTVQDSDSRTGSVRFPTIRYVLLQPARFFDNVLKEAHALALVGGTLRPFVHVAAELLGREHLIKNASEADQAVRQGSNRVSQCFRSSTFTAFTCDHVIPESHVILQCWPKGPQSLALDFRHQSRAKDSVMDELGQTMVEICRVTPNGVVVFVPSYSYEAQLVQRWKRSGLWESLLKVKKRIHREPKQSQQIENSLRLYSKDAGDSGGALLLSVVGGKMSEGINFSNEMARCVVVVGLPYPNLVDPEIQEKMALMDQNGGEVSGRSYYQNLCMRAINQSAGRAIRHAKDYAAVVLLDQRYCTDQTIRSGLPEWLMRGETRSLSNNYRERVEHLEKFFARHKREEPSNTT